MGFYLDIEDAGKDYADSKWDNGKYAYLSELWAVIQNHWTDVKRGVDESYARRPASETEAESVRAILRTWPEDHNRDLFLHGVDVVAKNPTLRFVPSY